MCCLLPAAGSLIGSIGSGTLGSCRLGSGLLSPSSRSFHHFVPELPSLHAAPSRTRRAELATWSLDCTNMTKEQLV